MFKSIPSADRSKPTRCAMLATMISFSAASAPAHAASQFDISAELETLQAEFVSASVAPHKRREGLALTWLFKSPLASKGLGIEQEYRSAARGICLKSGLIRFREMQKKPEYANLKYFVVRLYRPARKVPMLIPFPTLKLIWLTPTVTLGLEFEPENDCKEF